VDFIDTFGRSILWMASSGDFNIDQFKLILENVNFKMHEGIKLKGEYKSLFEEKMLLNELSNSGESRFSL